jgi:rubredoxin/uncharacterized membrane protein
MKRWECSVCGYIHEGEEPPLQCPICKADKDKFFEIEPLEEIVTPPESDNETGDEILESSSQEQPTIIAKITDLILENHLHPISVHSPNGIIPVAFVFLALIVFFQFSGFENAVYYNMVAVLLSMPLVLLTGYVTWQKKYKGAKTSVFKIKIGASCAATIILFGLVVWKTIQPDILATASSGRWLFLVWSLLLLAAVGLAGHLGGQLVFAKQK